MAQVDGDDIGRRPRAPPLAELAEGESERREVVVTASGVGGVAERLLEEYEVERGAGQHLPDPRRPRACVGTPQHGRVRALPAAHEAHGEACLYAIAGPDATVLWGTDTGPWAPAVRQMLAGSRLDLVLLEETFGDSADTTGGGHHNLATFALALGQLREWGCAGPSTDVVAIHLSHHNPPPEHLYLRLRDIGARAVPDGTPIVAGGVRTSLIL